MREVASPYHQKLKFPPKHKIVEIRGKQEYARYCFGLAMQSALAEQRPTELTESLQARGKEITTEQKGVTKRKCETSDKLKSSQKKGKATNQ